MAVMQGAEIIFMYAIKYWMYPALLSLFLLVASIGYSHTLRQQHGKLQRLATANMRKVLPIVDRGWVRAICAHRLLPGDVLVLHSGPACCDMVLLRGVCLVEEFSHSGEVLLALASCIVMHALLAWPMMLPIQHYEQALHIARMLFPALLRVVSDRRLMHEQIVSCLTSW